MPDVEAQTLAHSQAAQNWARNLSALSLVQPVIAESAASAQVEAQWVFGRDGALTALLEGRWWSGTSLPRQVARSILKSLEIQGGVGCFLNPTHSAHVQTALERLKVGQSIVAAVPDVRTLRLILHGADFSRAIGCHQLWFAAGETWAAQLDSIFREYPGLPLPQQFIRLPGIDDEQIDRMIPLAEELITRLTTHRASLSHNLRMQKRSGVCGNPRVCLAVGLQFKLWDDAGYTLAAALLGPSVRNDEAILCLDLDDPISASPLALAQAAGECDALVTANLGRSDLPQVASPDQPWISWITLPRVPAYSSASWGDGVILADEAWVSLAQAAGWPAERVAVAGWPMQPMPLPPVSDGYAALIIDTTDLKPPSPVEDMSSHRLLWDMIAAELRGNPFLLDENLDQYLDERMRRMGICEEGFDRGLFIRDLIVPAYQQGLAASLVTEKMPVRLFGRGWGLLAEFSRFSGGEIRSREEFIAAVAGAGAVVYVWPGSHAHAIDAAGRPVIRRTGSRRESFIRQAKLAMAGKLTNTATGAMPLSRSLVWEMITGGLKQGT